MKEDEKRELFNAFGLAGTIGFQMAASIGVGLFAGRYTDDYLGSSPIATIAGIILGIFAGALAMYKKIMENR